MRDSYMLYTDKLEGEYQEVFKQIDNYVTAERVDEDTQEEYMGELLDVFLLAQEEGKTVTKITGNDIEQFCKSFCEDFTWKNKILGAMDIWKNFAWIIFIMSTMEVLSVLYAMSIPTGREIDFWTEPYEFNFIGYFLAFMMAFFFSDETNFIQFPGWTLMLGSGVILIIYYVLNRTRVKERRESKVKFWDKVAEGIVEDVPKVKIERFERINREV